MKNVTAFRKGVLGLALASLAGATFLTSGSSAYMLRGDKVSETREVESFTKVRIKGAFELDLIAGKEFSLAVEGKERDLEYVDTYVRGDRLTVDNSDSDEDGTKIDTDGVKVTITMPTIEEFEVLGAVDAELKGINSESFVFELKGAGSVDISGECGALELEIKGAGEVDAENLECRDVEVSVKGVGEADVYASESVDADVSGIGSITVYGAPQKVRQSDSWLGKIRIK